MYAFLKDRLAQLAGNGPAFEQRMCAHTTVLSMLWHHLSVVHTTSWDLFLVKVALVLESGQKALGTHRMGFTQGQYETEKETCDSGIRRHQTSVLPT